MRMRMAGFLGLLLLLLPCSLAWSGDPVVLSSTLRHVVHSQVNGADYQLTIVLPPDYEEDSGKRYPTLYLMDGNRWAELLAVLQPRFTRNAGFPPVIVVGVDYPGKTERYLDYGPVSQRYFTVPEGRGYATFLRVLKEEIIPFVDANYRTDPGDRGVGGHSMGGLFSAYALLNGSDTFGRFLISSPSLFYDDEILFKDFEAFSRKKIDKPLYVFTAVGEEELPTMIGTLERFGERAKKSQPDHVVLRMMVAPEAGHATVFPSIVAPALRHMYLYQEEVMPSAADLYRASGHYRAPDGTILMFVTDGRTLMYGDSTIDYDNGSLVRMKAYAPNRFSTGESATQYEFPEGMGRADRVRILGRGSDKPEEALRIPPKDIDSSDRPVNLGVP